MDNTPEANSDVEMVEDLEDDVEDFEAFQAIAIRNKKTTDALHIRGTYVPDVIRDNAVRIFWTAHDRQLMAAHLARHKLQLGNCSVEYLPELVAALGLEEHCSRSPEYHNVVNRKLGGALPLLLRRLAKEGHVSITDRKPHSAIWKAYTEDWTVEGWDGDMTPPVVSRALPMPHGQTSPTSNPTPIESPYPPSSPSPPQSRQSSPSPSPRPSPQTPSGIFPFCGTVQIPGGTWGDIDWIRPEDSASIRESSPRCLNSQAQAPWTSTPIHIPTTESHSSRWTQAPAQRHTTPLTNCQISQAPSQRQMQPSSRPFSQPPPSLALSAIPTPIPQAPQSIASIATPRPTGLATSIFAMARAGAGAEPSVSRAQQLHHSSRSNINLSDLASGKRALKRQVTTHPRPVPQPPPQNIQAQPARASIQPMSKYAGSVACTSTPPIPIRRPPLSIDELQDLLGKMFTLAHLIQQQAHLPQHSLTVRKARNTMTQLRDRAPGSVAAMVLWVMSADIDHLSGFATQRR
ncbi:hypothetical protein HG530_014539 [Fusarium avenaceum]|nr:hypothetical protein HG530_014539 [Fusarium avenaceum]